MSAPAWMKELGLSTRAANGIFAHCIRKGIDPSTLTLSDIADVADSDLYRLRGVGRASIAEIRAALRSASVRPKPPPGPGPEEVARAVLRAYFGDPGGFRDMSHGQRAHAVDAASAAMGKPR